MHMVGTDSSVGWGDGYYGRGLSWSEEALGESDIEAEIKGTCELAALGDEEGEDGDQQREQRFQRLWAGESTVHVEEAEWSRMVGTWSGRPTGGQAP